MRTKCPLITSDNKEVFKEAFKNPRWYDEYEINIHNEDVYFVNSKKLYLFWGHESYPLILVGNSRQEYLNKIGKFDGGMPEVLDALNVMCFTKPTDQMFLLFLEPHTNDLYRVMVPKIRRQTMPDYLKDVKTMVEYEKLREDMLKETEAKDVEA